MKRPLAHALRPKTIDEIVGQEHLLGHGAPLRIVIEVDQLSSCILYGQAGCGKTTIAETIANHTESEFLKLNATQATVKEIRTIGNHASDMGVRTLLFVDEIYKFSKTQQSVLLPFLEEGSLIFIGATTENPFHSLINALNSRSLIFELEPLNSAHMAVILRRGVNYLKKRSKHISIAPSAASRIIKVSSGDARKCLTTLEVAHQIAPDGKITKEVVDKLVPNKLMVFSKDAHYDFASAYQGSIQASDPDAAVYWLAKWLESGEDPRYIARRLMVSASEDAAGNPEAAAVAHNAYISAKEVGRPECDIILAHATILTATAPRNKSAAEAIWNAVKDVKHGADVWVPKEMKDSHYKGAEKLGHGAYHDGSKMDKYVGVSKKYYRPEKWGYPGKDMKKEQEP